MGPQRGSIEKGSLMILISDSSSCSLFSVNVSAFQMIGITMTYGALLLAAIPTTTEGSSKPRVPAACRRFSSLRSCASTCVCCSPFFVEHLLLQTRQ